MAQISERRARIIIAKLRSARDTIYGFPWSRKPAEIEGAEEKIEQVIEEIKESLDRR